MPDYLIYLKLTMARADKGNTITYVWIQKEDEQ